MIRIEGTLQEIFDKIAQHLIKQNKQSYCDSTSNCAYRGDNGLMCAAGILIPDSEYKPAFERKTWHNLTQDGIVEDKFSSEIRELQIIHDNYSTTVWYDKLIKFAYEYKLQVNFSKPEN